MVVEDVALSAITELKNVVTRNVATTELLEYAS